MGSCISKCSSATEDCNPIQDKIIIISQQSSLPSLPTIPSSKKPNPLSSSSSSPTLTISTTTTITTSSCSSVSKDRSLSNEFFWSCIKENPQIIKVDQNELNPTKKVPKKSPISASQTQRSKAIAAPTKQPIHGCTQQQAPKKARGSSPSLARQRSSGKEPERPKPISLQEQNSGHRSPSRRLDCRGLSPSPSRRFNGVSSRDLSKNSQENCKHRVASQGLSPSLSRRFNSDNSHDRSRNRQEVHRSLSPSPCRKFDGDSCKSGVGFAGNIPHTVAAEKENCPPARKGDKLRTHPQVDENVVGEMVSNHDSNSSVSVEDINNPLISLDCFIFL